MPRNDRGVRSVELPRSSSPFLPLFLILVLGAIDWGWYFFIDQLVTNAAREGARAGTMLPPRPPSTAGQAEIAAAETAAQDAALAFLQRVRLNPTGVMATYTTVGGTDAISVTVTYPVGSLTGFLRTLIPANASAASVMRWQ